MNNLNYDARGLLLFTLVFYNSCPNLISMPVSIKALPFQILQSNVFKGRFPCVFSDSSCEYYSRWEVKRKQGVGQMKKIQPQTNQKQRKKEFKELQSHFIINTFEVLIQIISSWTSEDCICVKQNLTTWFWHGCVLYLCGNSCLDVSTSSTVLTIFSLKLSFSGFWGILNKVHWVKYKQQQLLFRYPSFWQYMVTPMIDFQKKRILGEWQH